MDSDIASKNPPVVSSGLTKEEVREEMRMVLREEMVKLKADITVTIELKFKAVAEEVAALRLSMQFINNEFEDIRSTFKSNNDLTQKLEKENSTLRSEIADLGMRLNQIEQHSRANNLEVQCVPEFKGENLTTTIIQLGKAVDFKIDEGDIQLCTRTAKLNTKSARPRSIVAQFARLEARDGLLAAVAKFNKEHKDNKLNSGHLGISGEKQPVYVVEHLSATNKALHAATRVKAKALNYKFVWVKHGKIYVRKTESTEHVLIRNIESFNSLN